MISFENSGGIRCDILNMSPFGACLELTNHLEVPEDFILVVEIDDIQWPCHTIWRSGKRIGVAFK